MRRDVYSIFQTKNVFTFFFNNLAVKFFSFSLKTFNAFNYINLK